MSSPAVQPRSRAASLAGAAVERARLTVVPRPRVRTPKVPFVILVSMVMLGGVVGLLLFNTSMQQASFAATALEAQAADLSARQQTLKMEIERLRDPQRVAERAQRMGMVLPSSPLFLDLADGDVLGQAAPATAESQLVLQPPAPAMPGELAPAPHIEIVRPPEGVLPDGGRGAGDGSPSGSGAESDRDTGATSGREGRRQGRNGSESESQDSRQSQQSQQQDQQSRGARR